jgi:hypothetical protein
MIVQATEPTYSIVVQPEGRVMHTRKCLAFCEGYLRAFGQIASDGERAEMVPEDGHVRLAD